MISWSALGIHRGGRVLHGSLGRASVPWRGRMRRRGTVSGELPRGPVRHAPRVGPFRPAASVTRRSSAGQTRDRAPGYAGRSGRGACRHEGRPSERRRRRRTAPLYCRTCESTTRARVSLRDRRDARPDARHLRRHPELRRSAVQGPATIDGADPGARAIRAGRQADPAVRPVQARRHRGLQAARSWADDGTPFIKRVIGEPGDKVEIRDDGLVYVNGTALDEPYIYADEPGGTPQPTTAPLEQSTWTVPAGELFLMGDHRQNSAIRGPSDQCPSTRSSAGPGCATGHSTRSGSSRHHAIRRPRARRPHRQPLHEQVGAPAMNPVLAGIALAIVAAAVVTVAAHDARSTVLGLAVVLIATPVMAEPVPAAAGLAARFVAAILAAYLLWIVTRDRPRTGRPGLPGASTEGSRIGWPADALVGAAAFVVGFAAHGLGAPALGPASPAPPGSPWPRWDSAPPSPAATCSGWASGRCCSSMPGSSSGRRSAGRPATSNSSSPPGPSWC